ncbi:hypothetical protein FRB99_001069 [Tulasnella sp. 403]|nr:hypothetical protein FRB99_001069 [Tulasnella sp. 403]
MDLIRQPEFIFKVVNIAVGTLLEAGAIGHFIWRSLSSIVIGVYALLFGAVVIALEFWTPPPEYTTKLYRYASFLYSFAGRGVFYFLAGVLLLNHYTLLYVSGTFVGFVGLVYFILEFVKMVEVPPSMVAPDHDDPESRPVWSADQDS